MSIEFVGVSVERGGRRVVDEVHASVPDGSFVGLLGPNGSGKSTLVDSVYLGRRPASGRVLLDGRDVAGMRPRALARRVAVLAQQASVEFDLTAAEMVMIGRTPLKRGFEPDRDADRNAVSEALGRVGAGGLAGRGFNTLSGGERQRVLIARAIAQGADHILLDEPTNHLDVRYQLQVLELVAGLGVTVLAALHDLSLAALFCDRVHLLRAGRVLASGPPADVITTESVRRAYGADVLVVPHPDTGTPHLIPRRARVDTPAGNRM